MIQQTLYPVEEVSVMIREGKKLLLAGDAKLLAQLPKGDWIGGSTPYFILYPEQMIESTEKLFVHCLPDFVDKVEIREYDSSNIKNIFCDAPKNGFTALIMPFATPIANEYMLNASNFKHFAVYPVCGWISACKLEKALTDKTYTASGVGPYISSEKGVAMHISLPETKYAEIHILNPYEQGDSDVVTFENAGQIVDNACINGVRQNFAEYLRKNNIDYENIPMVANYSGAMLNTNCLEVRNDIVHLSTAVFERLEYRFAKMNPKVTALELDNDRIIFSFTCVHNYFRPDIIEKYLKKMNGPVVFGEIAYQLLNRTTVYVTIDDVQQNTETK